MMEINKFVNDGDNCVNFNDYFAINQHKMNTRNKNILVKTPNVRLEFAKNSFYFVGAKIYKLPSPKEIIENNTDFKKQVKLFFTFDFFFYKCFQVNSIFNCNLLDLMDIC